MTTGCRSTEGLDCDYVELGRTLFSNSCSKQQACRKIFRINTFSRKQVARGPEVDCEFTLRCIMSSGPPKKWLKESLLSFFKPGVIAELFSVAENEMKSHTHGTKT